jgi:hypothetical protein
MKEIKTLNFDKLISIDFEKSITEYNFNDYLNKTKHQINGFCVDCEDKGLSSSPKDPSFRLQNISHGATTNDFLEATDKNINELDESWTDEGVVLDT